LQEMFFWVLGVRERSFAEKGLKASTRSTLTSNILTRSCSNAYMRL